MKKRSFLKSILVGVGGGLMVPLDLLAVKIGLCRPRKTILIYMKGFYMKDYSSAAEQRTHNSRVEGSNPSGPT